MDQPSIIVAILTVFYGLFEWNFHSYKRFGGSAPARWPSVSVLVPCRNEAKRIAENITSLLKQDYPGGLEVIVLDDCSNDGTEDILRNLEKQNKRLRVICGKELPIGWQGKNFACHQLSEAAKNEWMLFVDADTNHDPKSVEMAVRTATSRGASLISTFPRQKFGSFGDELVVPLMFYVLLTYLPMFFVQKRTWKWAGNFATACGQYLLVESKAYREAGGHGAVKGRISEGPLLATWIKNSGRKILLVDGSRYVSCRMYENLKQAWEGFSRSVFASMGGSVGALIFFLAFQTYVLVFPYILLAMGLANGTLTPETTAKLALCIAFPIIQRLRIHLRTGMSLRGIPFHALSICLYHLIMINSFIHYRVRKNTVWKNRVYVEPQA